MLLPIFIVSLIGFGLSLYALFVERNIAKNPTYKPACDISERVSCSKPFKSPYGKIFTLSNTIVGMIFYALMALLAFLELRTPLFFLSILSVGATLILAYILYTKIRSWCPVCTAIYVVNILLFILSYQAWIS